MACQTSITRNRTTTKMIAMEKNNEVLDSSLLLKLLLLNWTSNIIRTSLRITILFRFLYFYYIIHMMIIVNQSGKIFCTKITTVPNNVSSEDAASNFSLIQSSSSSSPTANWQIHQDSRIIVSSNSNTKNNSGYDNNHSNSSSSSIQNASSFILFSKKESINKSKKRSINEFSSFLNQKKTLESIQSILDPRDHHSFSSTSSSSWSNVIHSKLNSISDSIVSSSTRLNNNNELNDNKNKQKNVPNPETKVPSLLSSKKVTESKPRKSVAPSNKYHYYKTPELGFGSFPKLECENFEDENDNDIAINSNENDNYKKIDKDCVVNNNISYYSDSKYRKFKNKNITLFSNQNYLNETNHFIGDTDDSEISIGDDDSDFSFDIIGSLLPQIERILIIGNREKLPPPMENYLMKQAMPIDFDGCYCDHHYQRNYHRGDGIIHSSSFDSNYDFNEENETIDFNHEHEQHHHQPEHSEQKQLKAVFCYCSGESVKEIPRNFSKSVVKILLNRVALEILRKGDLQLYPNLAEINMQAMYHLHTIEPGAFSQLPNLMSINIKMAPQLQKIQDGVFAGSLPKLMHLKITHSGLERLPMISPTNTDVIISMIDFDNSRIRNITEYSITVKAGSLHIEYNQIEFISNYAFNGSEIAKLSLKGNKKLVHLQEHAFSGLRELQELDLSQTSITKLPTNGLSETLEILRITDTFTLKEIPLIYHFNKMKEAHLTYPYHCCAFKFPANHDPIEYERMKNLFNTDKSCSEKKTSIDNDFESVIPTDRHQTLTTFIWDRIFSPISSYLSFTPSQTPKTISDLNVGKKYHKFKRETSNNISIIGFHENKNEPVYGVLVFHDENQTMRPYEIFENRIKNIMPNTINDENLIKFNQKHNHKDDAIPGEWAPPHPPTRPRYEFCGNIENRMPSVKCFPSPDAFNPCEDVMGKTYLRIVVWFVAFAAVSGNVSVIVVLMSSRFTFNVSKFLMINLSIADLMMGVYLFIIAGVDLRTQGVYFNYAIDWQHGIGCKIAGFITVFAQLLSIFTLTVITLERLFAITYAIQLNRRLKLNLAVKVMIAGWFIVILLASLPLFGISSYSKTSICLPMEHKSTADVVYLVSLLIVNQLSFIIICACYSKMYFSIVSQKTRPTMNDMTIAKRMALLVFTDFACWAPIAFFGLTAIAGYPFIDVTNSKILLVTIYPLNSCANPFLYVIFTKQYRRDFFILVSRYGLCKKKALRYKPARNFNQINHHHHHHHHHAHHGSHPHSIPNSSDLHQKSNQCAAKSNQICSCPLQSFESSNLHIYKHKGQHHHHYCALYNNCEFNSQLSSNQCMICNPNSCSESHHNHNNHHHQGVASPKTDNNEDNCSMHHHPHHIHQDCDSNCSRSLEIEKDKKHRKHKRCHHYPISYCRYQRRGQPQQSHSCNSISNHSNHIKMDSPNPCCPGTAPGTICQEPPSNSSNDGCRIRHLSCGNRNNPNSNESISNVNSMVGNEIKECVCKGKHHDLELLDNNSTNQQPDKSSSCEKVHIMRNLCKNSSCNEVNGKVIFTRHKKNVDPEQKSSTLELPRTLMINKKSRNTTAEKRGSIFSSILRRMSLFTKATESSTCGSPEQESSDSGSPYSSSNSSANHHHRHHQYYHHHHGQRRNNHHYHHYCHHYRCEHCGYPRNKTTPTTTAMAITAADCDGDKDINQQQPITTIPIEQEREILHQALKETTTIQEAVAVVEELSSGARISMASSSSSKKA